MTLNFSILLPNLLHCSKNYPLLITFIKYLRHICHGMCCRVHHGWFYCVLNFEQRDSFQYEIPDNGGHFMNEQENTFLLLSFFLFSQWLVIFIAVREYVYHHRAKCQISDLFILFFFPSAHSGNQSIFRMRLFALTSLSCHFGLSLHY